jgi:dTDP-4-dehydrorhamnose reductase
MKVLILGASGMLGNTLFRYLPHKYEVMGTVRNFQGVEKFFFKDKERLFYDVNIFNIDSLKQIFSLYRPDVIINCVGLVKQLEASKLHYDSVYINSFLPHELLKTCEIYGAKLIHFSTDCVFSGEQGGYLENDYADADDLYGRSKYLGEVGYSSNAITLRTSIIGHELNTNKSLVDWFLSQSNTVSGYRKAIFTGLPTIEIARVLSEFILPNIARLSGLYHLSVDAIDKFSLLCIIAEQYKKEIEIIEDCNLKIDRSLNSARFQQSTGYVPPAWSELIGFMHQDYMNFFKAKRNNE